jgi:hypothetical protein
MDEAHEEQGRHAWISPDKGRAAKRISNFAIEDEWKKYAYVGDAIGGCYQIDGHNFYAIHFPTADKTWGNFVDPLSDGG